MNCLCLRKVSSTYIVVVTCGCWIILPVVLSNKRKIDFSNIILSVAMKLLSCRSIIVFCRTVGSLELSSCRVLLYYVELLSYRSVEQWKYGAVSNREILLNYQAPSIIYSYIRKPSASELINQHLNEDLSRALYY